MTSTFAPNDVNTPTFATRYVSVGNAPMPMCRALPRRLLGIWAHPDDEAYLSAGLMARVVDAGGAVTVVTATSGEHGTGDATLAGTAGFAAVRQSELEASLAELGVTDVRFLGIPDGECAQAADGAVVAGLASTITEVAPDTIVTFGPDGITGHPDHRTVSRWTTEAWGLSGRKADLFYATMTSEFLARNADLHDRLGVFDEYGAAPASIPTWSIALGCSLTEAELVRKRAALARHASQTGPLAEAVGEATYVGWWRDETFRFPTAAESHAGSLRALAGAVR
ncbi:MAG: PIG-L deacetylase family protein [Ilumatobacteraceae bacterium]